MAALGKERQAQAAATPTESESVYQELLPTSPLDITALIAMQRLMDGETTAGG